jgi:hypothetical protein
MHIQKACNPYTDFSILLQRHDPRALKTLQKYVFSIKYIVQMVSDTQPISHRQVASDMNGSRRDS